MARLVSSRRSRDEGRRESLDRPRRSEPLSRKRRRAVLRVKLSVRMRARWLLEKEPRPRDWSRISRSAATWTKPEAQWSDRTVLGVAWPKSRENLTVSGAPSGQSSSSRVPSGPSHTRRRQKASESPLAKALM